MLFNTFDFLLSAVLYALLFILLSVAPFHLHILLIILWTSNRFSLNWILTTFIWRIIANCIHVQIHVGTGECVVFMCAYTGMFIVLNVYLWVCLYLYAYVCVCIFQEIHIFLLDVKLCVCILPYVCLCVYVSKYLFMQVHTCRCADVYMFVCVCLCMFMCVYVWIVCIGMRVLVHMDVCIQYFFLILWRHFLRTR